MTDFLQDNPHGQIITTDEMSLYVQATTTRLWAPCGQTPVVRVSGQRDHVHFYAALNLGNGHAFALPRPQMTSAETAEFLRDLFACYPDQPILLLWNRANWHKGSPVTDVLADHPRVETIFFRLPAPISTHSSLCGCWRVPMSATTHTLPALRDPFLRYLANTSFQFAWLDKYVPPILLRQV